MDSTSGASHRLANPTTLDLGPDPLAAAYDVAFEMVEMVVSKTAPFEQELIGFRFVDGAPAPAHAVRIDSSQRLKALMDEMLERCPVVAHVFQGWSIPSADASRDAHVRHELIVIAMHQRNASRMATCRVNRHGQRLDPVIAKGPLRPVTRGPHETHSVAE